MPNGQDEASGLTNRIITEVKGEAKVGEPGIEQTQTAQVNGTVFKETDLTELPNCPCGAVLHNIQEVGGIDCRSKSLLCIPCSMVKCTRCLKSVGVESRINLFGNVYCKKCATRLGIYALVVFAVVIAIVSLAIFI